MITDIQLHEIGFVENGFFNSIHIGGPWYLHAYKMDKSLGITYGNKDPKEGDQVSIWATFTDIEKLKKLIELLKGDKR